MTALITAAIGVLILARLSRSTASGFGRHRRHIRVGRLVPRARRTAAEAEERRCAEQLLAGRIDAATYRRRMTDLAHRIPPPYCRGSPGVGLVPRQTTPRWNRVLARVEAAKLSRTPSLSPLGCLA